MTDQRPLLLVIGTGDQGFREYLLKSISSRYRLYLLLGQQPSWERQYASGWQVLTDPAETIAADEMCTIAERLHAEQPIAGVLAWDEARVLQAAKVAAALGLPGGDPDAVMRCRDKQLTRQALAAAGVPQPASALVGSPVEALTAADRIGYPVVLKPRALAASLGVVRVDTPQQLAEQFGFARDTSVPGAWQYDVSVLVEECVTGAEVSVDAAVYDGEVLPMFVAHKEIGYPPYFEEIGHEVTAADPLLTDPRLRQIVQDTHTALGFTNGMTHTELKLTPSGPKVVEVNARLGGDLIPYLGLRATGIDPGLAAAAVAVGQRPQLSTSRSRAAAVRFFYVDQDDTTIHRIEVSEQRLPVGTTVTALVAPGAVVSPPPKGTAWGRIGYATAVADTLAQCREALVAAWATVTVETGRSPAMPPAVTVKPVTVKPAAAPAAGAAG